jgi:hypothetical protein
VALLSNALVERLSSYARERDGFNITRCCI